MKRMYNVNFIRDAGGGLASRGPNPQKLAKKLTTTAYFRRRRRRKFGGKLSFLVRKVTFLDKNDNFCENF